MNFREIIRKELNEGYGLDSFLEKREEANKKNPNRFNHLKWKLNSAQHNFLNYFIDLHPSAHREDDLKYAENLTKIPSKSILSIINTCGVYNNTNFKVPDGMVPKGEGMPEESNYKWGNKGVPASEYDWEQKYRTDGINFKTVSEEELDQIKHPNDLKYKNEKLRDEEEEGYAFSLDRTYESEDISDKLIEFLGDVGPKKGYSIKSYQVHPNGEVEIDFLDYGDPYYDLHYDLVGFNLDNESSYEIKRYVKTKEAWENEYKAYINRKQERHMVPGSLNEARKFIRKTIKEGLGDEMSGKLGYKLMGYKDGKLYSIENNERTYPVKIGSLYIMPGGIEMANSKEEVFSRYENVENSGEVILTFSYMDSDVKARNDNSVKVKRAKLIDFEELNSDKGSIEEYGDQTIQGGARNPVPGIPREFPKFDEDGKPSLYEAGLEEDYPASFDMEYFKSLNSFNKRIKYCEEHLTRISSGSSRIVYKIDDKKVLKLAKNKAGIAQNREEGKSDSYRDISDIIAKTFDIDDNDYLWIEMELARKMKLSDFNKITGFKFKDFQAAVNNYGNQVSGNGRNEYTMPVDKKVVEDMWEDEFVYEIFDYMGSYGAPAGDLMRPSSYGVVNRGSGEEIVLVDYGLSDEIHANYYS